MRLDKLVTRLCALLNAANQLGVRIRTGGRPPYLRVFWPADESRHMAWINWDPMAEQWVAIGLTTHISDAQQQVLRALLEQANGLLDEGWPLRERDGQPKEKEA